MRDGQNAATSQQRTNLLDFDLSWVPVYREYDDEVVRAAGNAV